MVENAPATDQCNFVPVDPSPPPPPPQKRRRTKSGVGCEPPPGVVGRQGVLGVGTSPEVGPADMAQILNDTGARRDIIHIISGKTTLLVELFRLVLGTRVLATSFAFASFAEQRSHVSPELAAAVCSIAAKMEGARVAPAVIRSLRLRIVGARFAHSVDVVEARIFNAWARDPSARVHGCTGLNV